MISEAFVPSVGNYGQVGRFIGGCSGTVLVLCSGIATFVKCSSSSMGVYMYPPFDQGWYASSHPSPMYFIRICSLRYLYWAAFIFNLSNSQKASMAVFEQWGELYCWWRYDAFMKSCIDAVSLFSFANFSFCSDFSSCNRSLLLKSCQVALACLRPVTIRGSVNSSGSWWNNPMTALGLSLPFLPGTMYSWAQPISLLYLAWLCPAAPSSPTLPPVLNASVKVANTASEGSLTASSSCRHSSQHLILAPSYICLP